MFSIRLLNRDRTLLAVLDRITTWGYTRKPSQATQISVGVPYELVRDQLPLNHPLYAYLSPSNDPKKLQHAQIANYLQIWEGETLRASGRITTRDVTATNVTVRALTEEILLERNLCPAQYGRVFDNWDLADLARFILKGWYTQRVKSRDQWAAAIEMVNVDIDADPGLVLLAKDGSGRYSASGYITMRFTKSEFPDFAGWDRIRWTSDNQEPVTTTMQYRYGDAPDNMGAWSNEITGASPDEMGVVPETVDAAYIDVRINLRTSDTEQEDPNGKPVGQTPAVFALEMVSRTPAVLQVGDVPVTAGVTVKALEADHDTSLSILIDACEQAGWEFEVINGCLNLVPKIGVDRRKSFVFREGTNTKIDRLRDDDSELVNVLNAVGPGDGLNRLQLVLRDRESIETYDVHPKTVEFEVETEADLRVKAEAYLEEHKTPIQGFDIQDTYDVKSRPEYGVGDHVRVVDPRSGSVVDSRILEHTRVYTTRGLRVTNRLGKPRASLVERTLRVSTTKGLDAPRLSVTPIIKGVVVRIPTPAPSNRWATTELYASTVANFTPGPETLQDNGRRTRFEITGIEAGKRYYYKARYVATDGTLSPYSEERSAVARDVLPPDFGLDDLDDYTNNAIPTAPTGLAAFRAFKAFALTWEMAMPTPRIERYEVQYATSSDGVIWAAWATCGVDIRSTHYTHQALDVKLHYKYRVRAVSLAGIEGPWSDELVASVPGKASLSEDVVDQLARERLSLDVQSELDGLDQGLTDAKGRLISAEGRLTTAETSLTNAQERLGTAEAAITNTKSRLTSAEGRLGTAETSLTAAEGRLTSAEGRISTAETSITTMDDQIALKASATDLNAVAGRVTTAESTLIQHAQDIAARVTQTVFDVLKGRVTTAEGTLTTHADEIAARVKQTVFDTLENRVTNAEGTLVVHADDIAARVTKTVFNTLESRVTNAEGTLTVQAGEIAARVKQTVYDTLVGRVNAAETTLTQHANEIAARVTIEVYDTLVNRVTTAESTLTAHATAIEARVKQTVYDLLANRVTDAEGTLVTHANLIAARVTNTVFDTLAERVTSAESTISIHTDEIATRVTQTVFDALSGRVTTAEGKVTTQAGQITAIANRVTETESDISALTVQAGEISSTVALLGTTVGDHSTTIQQQADAINLRVVKGEVVSEINQSTEGIRISGKKIQLDGDTEVTGDFRIDGDLLLGGSVKHTAIDIGAPDSLAGIGISFGTDKLYQDAFGNWYVRVTLNLTGIPSDSKRAYIQIKYRRKGSTSYHLGDQIPLAYGNASVTVDGLTPDAEYEYSIVPSNHFGVEGVGKTVSRVTSKDETPPTQPIGVTARPILGGIAVDHGTTPPESDWDYDEVEVFGKQAVVGEGAAAGWQAFSGPYLVSKLDVTDQNVYSGNLAQRIQITDWIDPGAYDDVTLYQELPASEGQTWQASAWVMSDMSNVECYLTLQFYDANGNTLDGSDGYGYAEATYQNVLGSEMTAPSGTATAYVGITFVMMGLSSGTGNIYIDAASAIADGVEQLQNPDFEGSWTSQAIYKRRALHTEIADGLVPGNSYRARVRRVNTGGNISPWSDEVEAIAGRANTDGIEDGSVTTKKIEARAVTETDVLQIVDSSGASTTSDTFTDIPGFSLSFMLDEPTTCLIYMNLDGRSVAFGDSGTSSTFALKIDGSIVECSKRAIDVYIGEESHWTAVNSSIAVMTLQELSAGQHTIKGVFNAIDFSISSSQTTVCDRVLGVIALKR